MHSSRERLPEDRNGWAKESSPKNLGYLFINQLPTKVNYYLSWFEWVYFSPGFVALVSIPFSSQVILRYGYTPEESQIGISPSSISCILSLLKRKQRVLLALRLCLFSLFSFWLTIHPKKTESIQLNHFGRFPLGTSRRKVLLFFGLLKLLRKNPSRLISVILISVLDK